MKKDNDFEHGKNDRESFINKMNKVLHSMENELQFTSSDETKGIHFLLVHKTKRVGIPFIIMFISRGLYLKIPHKYIYEPLLYLEQLSEMKYHILISEVGSGMCSQPITINTIIKYWNWSMGGKGNENRLSFYGKASEVKLYSPPHQNRI